MDDREQNEIDKHYAIGLERISAQVRTMLLQFHDCHNAKENPIALQIYSELYGFSAKNAARAVSLHPGFFPIPDNLVLEDYPPADHLVSLRIMAGLGKEKEAKLFERWQEQNWPSWKVYEEVQALKHRRPRCSKQRGIINKAKVTKRDNKLIVVPENPKQADGISGELEVRFYVPV